MLNIIIIKLSCSRLVFINWLQAHLLPCPFKYLTGIDCPGCGFQRSVIALVKGDLHSSFLLYPPTIPLLLFFAFGIADRLFKLDKKDRAKKTLFIITGSIVLISYGIKMFGLYNHYSISTWAIR